MVTDAVADAGPLIHLDEVGRLDALQCLRTVVVPDPIRRELTLRHRLPGAAALDLPQVRVVAPSMEEMAFVRSIANQTQLSRADRTALAMARSRRHALLTDDLDLRDAAHPHEVRPVGSIGIILRAARDGIFDIAEATQALDDLLHESSLFITPALMERAKEALRNHLA